MAAIEVNSGFYVLDDAGLLSNPRGDSVAVLQRHTRNGRVAGHLYVFRGGQWRDVAYDDRSFWVDPVNGVNATNRGKARDNPFLTITYALSQAEGGKDEVIYCEPGEYDEAVVISKAKMTIAGLGGRGAAFVVPSAANGVAIKVAGVSDVSLSNIGGEGNGTGGGLWVNASDKVRRVRARSCKFEGGAFAAKLQGTGPDADDLTVSDTYLDDCELCWTETALHLVVTGAGDPVTQTFLRGCMLHNYSSRGVYVETSHADGLWILKNIFARQENSVEPTNEYVKADVAGTSGFMAGNHFPAAAASGKIVVDANLIKGGNGYSDGWAA